MCLNQHSLFQNNLDEISASPFVLKHSLETNDSQSISQSQTVADHQLSSLLTSCKKGGKKYIKVAEIFCLLLISYMLPACNLLYILMRSFNNSMKGRNIIEKLSSMHFHSGNMKKPLSLCITEAKVK